MSVQSPHDRFFRDSFSRPEVIQDAPLRYPPQAWENDVQGDVVLLLWVDEEGLVETGEVVSTPGYGMELAGVPCGPTRAPLLDLSATEKAEFKAVFEGMKG